MRYVLAIALILAAAVGLAWYRSSAMQADLVEAVEAALVAADAEDVLVSVDGMEVTLAGEVSDSATKERIDRAVALLPKIGRFVNAVEVVGAGGGSLAPESSTEAVAIDEAPSAEALPPVVASESAGSELSAGLEAAAAEPTASGSGCQAAIDAAFGRGSIDFGSSSAELDPASQPLLESLATALLSCGDVRVEIAGHTDASGPRDDNLELSLQRAEAVRTFLVASSVPASRLTAVGYGPDVPLVDNATPEGRALNRRIELKVVSP